MIIFETQALHDLRFGILIVLWTLAPKTLKDLVSIIRKHHNHTL